MTALELIYKAIKCYDDYPNRTEYGVDDLDDVTSVITTCVRHQIGVRPIEHLYEVTGEEDISGNFRKVPAPPDLTNDDQIVSIEAGGYSKLDTEGEEPVLLIPPGFIGTMRVTYTVELNSFTATTDTIPISDDAANTVAVYLLAEALSTRHRPSFSDRMAAKAKMALSNWKSRDYNYREVQDYYGF